MEKALIDALLGVFHKEQARVRKSRVLAEFVDTYNVGHHRGAALCFTAQDREAIHKLLLREEGIDAHHTHPGQWRGLTRQDSLALGHNEKLTREAVRPHRVAVKALPDRPLRLADRPLHLPPGSNLDIDGRRLAQCCRHTTVLVVENWEAFEGIDRIGLDLSPAGDNPLVVFRGSPVYPLNHARDLLEKLELPVFAFVDFDPAGLAIAQGLPRFVDVIAPEEGELHRRLAACTNHERYQRQLIQYPQVLDQAIHPRVRALWRLLQTYGTALPQESFLVGSNPD